MAERLGLNATDRMMELGSHLKVKRLDQRLNTIRHEEIFIDVTEDQAG